MPQIRRIDIPQLVRVRKYEVDCQRLCDLLREHKRLMGKSNKQLAEALNVPPTQVEHWFRKDSCFSIPGEDIWEALKDELSITTTEFDKSILTFEERPGVYEKSERCYFADGIAPTLTSTSAGNEKIIVEENNMSNFDIEPNVLVPKRTEYGKAIRKAYEAGKIKESRHNMTELEPRTDGICNTLTTVLKDNYVAVAMRGRYNEDGKVEQQVEMSDREYANTITSVQKDSMVASRMRIRKLTPKECFRLMGFDDADYEKAAAVNSNTQLYKQAGNSIGVPVVQHILQALIDCGALAQG